MLTDSQRTHLQMQKLALDSKKKELDNIKGSVLNLANAGTSIYQVIKDVKDVKENAEVNRAMNIANSYIANKIKTDISQRADYGEQTYRNELANFDIYSIQTIQEMNLSETVKNKLNSTWGQNKSNILGTYEATLPGYQMTSLKNEIERGAMLFYNDDISLDLEKQLKGYNDYLNQINPNKILIQGEKNLLLNDDHKENIINSVLANQLNQEKIKTTYNEKTLDNLIDKAKQEVLWDLNDNSSFQYLSKLKENELLKSKINELAIKRNSEKLSTIQDTQKEIMSNFNNNVISYLNNYTLKNRKSYTFDFSTDENGNFYKDESNILNDFVYQIKNIDTLNLSLEEKEAYKNQFLTTLSQSINSNLVNSVFNSNSFEDAYKTLGLSEDSNELAKDLFRGTDTQLRLKNLLDFAKDNNIDIATEQGKNTLKYFYKEYSNYKDTDLRKILNIRNMYDYLTKEQLITEIRNSNLDGQTQEQLVKEYDAMQSKYAPQIKEHFDNFIKDTTEKLYSEKKYKKLLNLENKSDKLPNSITKTLQDAMLRYLMENKNDINIFDEKNLKKLDNQLYSTLVESLDKDAADIFSGYFNDLDDLEINDESSLEFIYKSQQNLLYTNTFNEVFDFLNKAPIDLKDFSSNKTKFLDYIAKEFFSSDSYDSLDRVEQIGAQGGLAYFGILKTREQSLNKTLSNIEKYDNGKEIVPVYEIEKVVFDDNKTPRYIINNHSLNNNPNIAIILTPQSFFTEKKFFIDPEMMEKLKINPNMKNVPIGDYQDVYYDNFIISCALKNSDGSINWQTASDRNFTNGNYKVFSVPREFENNKELENKLLDIQKELDDFINSFSMENKVWNY